MKKTTTPQRGPAWASTIRKGRCCPTDRSLAGQKFNRANGHQILTRRAPVDFSQRDYFGARLAVLSQRELFATLHLRTDNLCRLSPQLSQCRFHASTLHTFSEGATDFLSCATDFRGSLKAAEECSAEEWGKDHLLIYSFAEHSSADDSRVFSLPLASLFWLRLPR
jgi:hypothetical protein